MLKYDVSTSLKQNTFVHIYSATCQASQLYKKISRELYFQVMITNWEGASELPKIPRRRIEILAANHLSSFPLAATGAFPPF